MKIVKEYNLEELEKEMKSVIESSRNGDGKTGSIDIIKAQEIVEVLHYFFQIESHGYFKGLYEEECECIGCYDNTSLECLNCEVKKYCVTDKENEVVNNKSCFGDCVKDDYGCTHCLFYEECMLKTYNGVYDKED